MAAIHARAPGSQLAIMMLILAEDIVGVQLMSKLCTTSVAHPALLLVWLVSDFHFLRLELEPRNFDASAHAIATVQLPRLHLQRGAPKL